MIIFAKLILNKSNLFLQGFTKCYQSSFRDADPLANVNNFRVTYPALYRLYKTGEKEFRLSTHPAFKGAKFADSYAANTSTVSCQLSN